MERNRVFSEDLTETITSEERMSVMEWLAEQMPGGFFIYRADESTELLYVNGSTCDIFGCDSLQEFRQLTGNTFKGMVHPDDYDSIQSSIDNQIASESNSRHMDYVVYRIIRKDGTVRWVDDYGHFATLPGFGEVYYVFIGDITDTRLAAEEKEHSRNLALALEEAEHANVAKSAFLSNMSHEIRTPITAILGMNEMIQRETDDAGILEYSENIRRAGVSLLGIISDILDFSKIETGRMELSNEEYSLPSMVVDLYNLIQFRAEAKGLGIVFEIDPGLPHTLFGDEIRLKQIITNLLTNAVKYTEKGKVVFEMKLHGRSEDSAEILVSVTDTGIGIRKVDMDRLFEPFDRLDLKKTRSIEGSGLGLAITRQMLSIMGSNLKVESKYEEGSRFFFLLSQKVADATPVGAIDLKNLVHEKQDTGVRHALFTAPGMRLLVVDDTPMNLQVLAGLLKRTRMHIDVATSGAECIEKFGREHYDLVFLDYRMPQMNGIETLSEMRRQYPDKFEKTPVISLTASAVSGDKEKMLSAGFTDYLTKPVNVEEMETMMIKYLPAEAVILSKDRDEAENDELAKLPKIIFDYPQLDPEQGIEYCGDAEDYVFAMETYEMSIDTKAGQIEQNLADDNIEAFILNVHSLKSTSGAIGAAELFDKAKALEQAAKNGDYDIVRRDTPGLLKEYRALKPILKQVINKYEGAGEISQASLAVVEEERSRMLAKALAEAERANMAKTAFLSNMSHEIRTPMNAIIGLYNIALKSKTIDDDVRDILEKIGDSAKHLLALLNDILDISRIEYGNAVLRKEAFSFGGMIEQINTMMESRCEDRGLTYNCMIAGHVGDRYIGDEMKLEQLLINVLGNAVKYTPGPGKVTFIVEETERSDDRATIRFVVKDTGVGMDEKYLPKLFEPFSQERDGSSNSMGSTGLGMAIAKNIVDMMCGSIEVHSKKGKGSEFVICVPLGISHEDIADGSEPDFARVHALLVDDDREACEHGKKVLARIGIDADFVMSGADALSAMDHQSALGNPYNVIFVDWKMPGMDGIELTKKLRAGKEGKTFTIILTTYNWDEIMEEAIDAGVDAFLAKPLFASSIRQELMKILTQEDSKKSSEGRQVPLAGRRVILAEDMDINAQIMKQILSLKDVQVDMAGDGEKACRLFSESEEGSYDAILMDIRMPKMDGLKASERIRAMDRADAKTIPIIALTANAFDEDIQLSLAAGMNAHLSKPVEPDSLFTTLGRMISGEKEV